MTIVITLSLIAGAGFIYLSLREVEERKKGRK